MRNRYRTNFCGLLLVGSLGLAISSVPTQAVVIDWVDIGNAANAPDPASNLGAVARNYRISKTEVTNAQYVEFLNAKAGSDPLGLYNANMGDEKSGIVRNGSFGSFHYSIVAGTESWPVFGVTFYEAMRFANWLHNGQGDADTETGAYTLLGGTVIPSNGATVTRNPGAEVFVPTLDEWYKAAYYDPGSASYFAFPAGTDLQTACGSPTATPNTANCGCLSCQDQAVEVGSYPGSASPYGTLDQGGNAWEWTERLGYEGTRDIQGGAYYEGSAVFASTSRQSTAPENGYEGQGVRLASAPEPDLAAGFADFPLGDVTADGSVGRGDLHLVLGALTGQRSRRLSGHRRYHADITGDGRVDRTDLYLLAAKRFGLSTDRLVVSPQRLELEEGQSALVLTGNLGDGALTVKVGASDGITVEDVSNSAASGGAYRIHIDDTVVAGVIEFDAGEAGTATVVVDGELKVTNRGNQAR